MARLLIYYAHPGHRHSRVNREMAIAAAAITGASFVDLYADYPRFDVRADVEQRRLIDHDAIVLQFPLFWYSTPSILKEWQDVVLEYGFAYGHDACSLAGKRVQLAITVAGPRDQFAAGAYQRYPLRTFLTPIEQTARLCHMHFGAPYVLFSGLRATELGVVEAHVAGYRRMLEAIRDDTYDFETADGMDLVDFDTLPIRTA